MKSEEYGQMQLPINVRESRDVNWLASYEKEETRRSLFGKRVVKTIEFASQNPSEVIRRIDSSDIPKLTDPNLAYALRFQDAISRIGMVAHTSCEGASFGHNVSVRATDEGLDSKMLSVQYSGLDGAFEEFLQEGRPKQDENNEN